MSSSLIWLCGIREDQFTPGPKAAVQLRKDCRGHSLHSAWTGEKVRVGKSRGRKETGRGENAEGKREPQGSREADTRTRGSCSRPSPPARQSPLCRARRLQPAQDSTRSSAGWCVNHSVVSDSSRPHALQSARLLHPWDFPGKDTGVHCDSLCQGIFPTQGSNLYLLYCRRILYRLSHQGSQPPGRPLPPVYSAQRIKRHCPGFSLGQPHHQGTFSLPRGPSFPH